MSPDTLPVDRIFPGVGRIHRRSGTTKPAVLRKINRALDELYGEGRLDVLRAVRDRQITPMQAYDAVRRRAVAELPVGDAMPILSAAMDKWIENAKQAKRYSSNHLVNLKTARNYFAAIDPTARVADLPRVLEKLRAGPLGTTHARSFNIARGSATSFIRHTLKRNHPLWLACQAVEPLKIPRKLKRKLVEPLSAAEFARRFPRPESDAIDATAWSMATTGMRNNEYWGEWVIRADRVHIAGTKTDAAPRDIPLVLTPVVPTLSREWITRRWRARHKGTITPYDMRRTYARWMEEAQIPRARRKMYLGHSSGDVTGLYERHEITKYLVEDAERLRTYLGLPEPTGQPLRIAQ